MMTSSQRRIYLDYNATAPLLPEARQAIVAALSLNGNPSSVHAEGRLARRVVEEARSDVAALCGAAAENVVFTSGASEAAATCLCPEWIRNGRAFSVKRLAVLDTDHPCVREGGRFAAPLVTRLEVTSDGLLDFGSLAAWLDALPLEEHAVLALSLANSETGVIQPVEAIAEAIRGRNVILVVDAAQVAGRGVLDITRFRADALILSGHKIGAGKGVGAYVLASGDLLPAPLLTGGAQERRRRAGTEAIPAIAGFGAAAKVAAQRAHTPAALLALREKLEAGLMSLGRGLRVVGEAAPRIPNTVMVTGPSMSAETAQIALDLSGVAVSAGSACSSGKVGPSHVLTAMHRAGACFDPRLGGIRVSLGFDTTEAEIDTLIGEFAKLLARAGHGGSDRAAA